MPKAFLPHHGYAPSQHTLFLLIPDSPISPLMTIGHTALLWLQQALSSTPSPATNNATVHQGCKKNHNPRSTVQEEGQSSGICPPPAGCLWFPKTVPELESNPSGLTPAACLVISPPTVSMEVPLCASHLPSYALTTQELLPCPTLSLLWQEALGRMHLLCQVL